MQKILPVLIIFIMSLNTYSQQIKFFAVDTENYPKISAKYVVYNDEGKIINLNKKQLSVTHQRDTIQKVRITQYDDSKINPISVVLAIDVSGSMSGLNMQIAKEAAKQFIDLTPLYTSEIAIVAFDDRADLRVDFSQNKEELTDAIDMLSAGGGTEYNEAFSNNLLGALEIAKRGDHKRIVIFLTDGLGFANEKAVVEKAIENKVSVYSVAVNMPLPDVLKNISTKTAGKSFANIQTVYDAQATYIGILQIIEKSKFGEVFWTAPTTCEPEQTFKFSYQQKHQEITIPVPDSLLISMSFSSGFLDFGLPPSNNNTVTKSLKMKPLRGNINIDSIAVQNSVYFGFRANDTIPIMIDTTSSINFLVDYKPNDDSLRFSRLQIYTKQCGLNEVYVQGGDRKKIPPGTNLLKIISPNGKEIFSPGDRVLVEWEPVNKKAFANFSISTNSGSSFEPIGELSEGKGYLQLPGKVSNKCLLKVEENGGNIPTTQKDINLGVIQKLVRHPNNINFMAGSNRIIYVGDAYSDKSYKYTSTIGTITDFGFSPSGNLEYYYGRNLFVLKKFGQDSIKKFSPRKALGLIRTQGHKRKIYDLCISKNDDFVYTIGVDKKILMWDIAQQKQLKKIKARNQKTGNLYLSQTGDTLFVHTGSGTELYNAKTLDYLGVWELTKKQKNLKILPSGTVLAYQAKELMVLDADGKSIHEIAFPRNITSIDLSPDGFNLLVTSNERLLIYDAETYEYKKSQIIEKLPRHSKVIYGANSSNYLAANNRELWNISTYESGYYMDLSDDFFRIDQVSASTAEVNFGEVFIGKTSTGIFKNFFTNTSSNLPIHVTDIQIHGADSADFFILSMNPPFTVQPMANAKVEFAFNPGSLGLKEAELHIVTPSETFITTIKGVSIPPPFELQSRYISFGKIKPGHRVSKNAIILKNVSNQHLKLDDIKLRGSNHSQFIFKKALLKTSFAPGEVLRFKIDYAPTKRGITTLSLDFYFRDVPYPAAVTLVGECDAPKYIPVHVKTYDKLSGNPIVPNISSFDMATNKLYSRGKVQRDKQTSFIKLPIGRKVRLQAASSGYYPDSALLFFNTIIQHEYHNMTFYLVKKNFTPGELISTLYFDTGNASISTKSERELNELLTYLKSSDKFKITVEGHTDNEGTDEINEKLSLKRAETVKQYFVSRGVKPHQIETKGLSKSAPIADNADQANKYKNRRAEIKFKE